MNEKYKYEIGGKTYIQIPLVLGQVGQLMKLLQGLVIMRGIDTLGVVARLGDRLPQTIAIIITPDGLKLQDKDIQSLAGEIEFVISPEQTLQVIEDFFACNPIASHLEKLSGMAEKITAQMKRGNGLTNSPASSPEETSRKETQSSGDIPSESASRT